MNRAAQLVLVGVLAVAVAVAGFVAFRNDQSTPTAPSAIASDVGRTIPTSGARLAAEVLTPRATHDAPLVVMPGGWGSPATQYRAVAQDFARRGYVVVAYAQRGFSTSTGEADFAGTDSQRDASAVITWALAHTPADPKRIGMLGASYGAGISLLAAAHDRRIRAVVALSTWADVGAIFDQANTPSTAALATLIGGAHPAGRFDKTVETLRSTLASDPKKVGTAVRAISTIRSPQTYVNTLNKNKPAIMLANGFEDSIFPPQQLIPFYNALTTPKRLELAPGDHGGPELGGFEGQPDPTINDAVAWLDRYLRNQANGIDHATPIVLHDGHTTAVHGYKSWPVPSSRDRVPLGPPDGAAQASGASAKSWQAALAAGVDSVATSGGARLVSPSSYTAPQILTTRLTKKTAFVWTGPVVATPIVLGGTPSMNISLGSSSSAATIFVYLYDVTAAGLGTLVDVAPFTARNLAHGEHRPVTITMQPTSWTVPQGDHLTVVIDTVDGRYTSLTPPGATITVSASAAHPTYFTLPAAAH